MTDRASGNAARTEARPRWRTNDLIERLRELTPDTAATVRPKPNLVICSFCGGDGDRESESGEYVLRGQCRECKGKGWVVA
jgi:DnaJ-class molecular chaperone